MSRLCCCCGMHFGCLQTKAAPVACSVDAILLILFHIPMLLLPQPHSAHAASPSPSCTSLVSPASLPTSHPTSQGWRTEPAVPH